MEVLVTDDGSTDATLDIVEEHRSRLPALRIVRNERRLGAVANLNRAIETAAGAWIKPVFQDDLLAPGCLDALRGARKPDTAVVVCARSYLYEDGVADWRRQACEHLLREALNRRNGPGPVSADAVADRLVELAATGLPHLNFVGEPIAILLERDPTLAAGGFDPGYVQLWDYELVLRLAMDGGIVVVGDSLASFRVHEQSATGRNFANHAYRTNVIDPLRLLVAYATDDHYEPARQRAATVDPSIDLVATATRAALAAREELDTIESETQRTDAERLWSHTVRPLPPLPATSATTDRAGVGPLQPTRRVRWTARVSKVVRGGEWWAHMMGPLLTIAYLQLGWHDVSPRAGCWRMLLLLASATLLAAYGYAVNDASDIEVDRLAGKANAFTSISRPVQMAIIVALAFAGAVPWLFVELAPMSFALLATIYVLPLLYSARPIRLKERHLLGPLADAANAFVIPALFAVSLFSPFDGARGPAWLMVGGVAVWTVAYGLRGILAHQIVDAENDRVSRTRTLVLTVGVEETSQFVTLVLFPLELLGLVLLASTVAYWSWGAVLAGLAYLVVFHGARRLGAVSSPISPVAAENGYVSLMEWYEVWPTLILGVALVATDPWYVILVAVQLLLFRRSVSKQLNDLLHMTSESARWLRARGADR